MNLYSTFQITPVGPRTETVRNLGIAALFARIAAMTTKTLAIQHDGEGSPHPFQGRPKVGDRWPVWAAKHGKWEALDAHANGPDDVVVAPPSLARPTNTPGASNTSSARLPEMT